MPLLAYAGVLIAHALCFLPICAEAKTSRFHSLWMATTPTLILVAYDLSRKSLLHGPYAVAVMFILVVCGVGSFFGWPVILRRANDVQPYSNSATGLDLSRLVFIFVMPGLSAVAAIMTTLWFRGRRFAGFNVFSEPVSFPCTLERDPNIRRAFGLLFGVGVGWALLKLDSWAPNMQPPTILMAILYVVLIPWMFRRNHVVLTADGTDVPDFPTWRRYISYRDIAEVQVAAWRGVPNLRIDFYSSSRSLDSVYFLTPVDNPFDLATFIKKKADEVRPNRVAQQCTPATSSWVGIFDRWTTSLLVAFNILVVALPLFLGKGLSIILVGVLIAIIGQGMLAAGLGLAGSPGSRKQMLKVCLVILYFGLFGLAFV